MFVPDATPLPVSHRFATIIGGLCHAVAARMPAQGAALPRLLLLWAYLHRSLARFTALAERLRTGRLPRHRSPTHRLRQDRPRERLPQAPAWLVRLVPQAAACGGQLQHLLSDPEMAALIARAPQAGRILRPLCRMLGLQPVPALLPPPPMRPVRTARPATKPTLASPGRRALAGGQAAIRTLGRSRPATPRAPP